MKTLFNFAFASIFAIHCVMAQSPGNVSTNLQLWLKANQGTALTGTDVDSWTDQSSNTFIGASQGTADAQYVASGLNFNPTLRFTGNSFYNYGAPAVLDINPNSEEMTVITMVVTGGATTGTVLAKGDSGGTRNYQVWFGTTDRVLHHTLGRQGGNQAVRWGTIYALNEPKITTGVVSSLPLPSLRLTPYVNGVEDPADHNDGTFTGGDSSMDVLIGARRNSGNTGSGYRYNGDIAEVIIYDRALTTLERQKVESYLAIKYGVTLGSNDAYWDTPSNTSSPFGYGGTSNDYIASNNVTIWDGSDNAGYGYNVFGIARDDNSNLLQTKSKSVNIIPEAILTMESETGGLVTDLSYVLVGNNSDNVALKATGLPIRSTSIMERIWLTRESMNDAGTVKLEFDLSTSSITDAQAMNLDLFIADNDSFINYKNYVGTYNTTTNILTYTGIDFEDAEYFTLGTPQIFAGSFQMEFDGTDDYISTPVDLSGQLETTIMAWYKRDNNNDLFQTGIIGQPGVFSIAVEDDDLSVFWGGNLVGYGLNQTSTGIGNTNQEWYHVAASFNNGFVKLYYNGELISSGLDATGNTILSSLTSTSFSIGGNAASLLLPNYFDGLIDEVRVFDVALTDEQVQQMIYQEIEGNVGMVHGKSIPKDIEDLTSNAKIPWGNVLAYYSNSNIRGNCLVDESANALNGQLTNLGGSAISPQTAPMPYETLNDGAWTTEATWLHGNVWDIEDLPNKDWAIVKIHNKITTNADHTHLGLFVDNADSLTVNGTHELKNTWYLDLNGTIDLKDDSQLVQTEPSDLTITSAGNILRRQEGTNNIYRYNYWSSPIGEKSAVFNNTDFTFDMIKDDVGTLDFVTTYDPPITSPATLSSAWLYTFQNGVTYWDWATQTELSSVSPGVGYIHKGSGIGATEYQYIFDGKPNNGVISIPVADTGGPGSLEAISKTQYLLGNPYPSALDAHQFIIDNAGVSSGTLYLWEQWSGNSHILAEYEGGYAVLNLMDKTPAYQFVGIDGADNGNQDGTKTPTQFIPVAQGFMTEIEFDGIIEFNNGQRIFKEEALGESVFFRGENSRDAETDEEASVQNTFKKIRLEFKIDNVLSRHLVLGFSDITSDGYDYGYDSRPNKFQTNDLGLLLNDKPMVMQAYSTITNDKVIDLILNADGNHDYAIRLLGTENIDAAQEIFIYDTQEDIYFDLRDNELYEFSAPAGTNTERFKVVFKSNEPLLSQNEIELENAILFIDQSSKMLFVKGLNDDVAEIQVTNMLGQIIKSIQGPISKTTLESGLQMDDFSSGTYLFKVTQNDGKKIIKKITIK